jgi:hypothetical protein
VNLSKVPWIGFVHVRPASGSATLGDGAKGAYANVLALAENESDFLHAVRTEMSANGLVLIEASDIAPVSEYERDGRIHSEMQQLREALSLEYPVQYQDFHTYDRDDG